MKAGIHPTYVTATVVCTSCGTTWQTRSTRPEIRTELCSVCHPFFTGEQRIVDSQGQVERFMNKVNNAQPARTKSRKQIMREAKLEETRRARTFTPELDAIAGEGADAPAS